MKRNLASLFAIILPVSLTIVDGQAADEKETGMTFSSSQAPSPDVPPIIHDGVRYEQVNDTTGIDTDSPFGWMRATRIADGEVLWTRQIYTKETENPFGKSLAYVYFESMSLDAEAGFILVTNEDSERFRVDISTGDSVAD